VSYALQAQNGLNGIYNDDNWYSSYGPQGARQMLTISGIAELPWGLQLGLISTFSGVGPTMPNIAGVDLTGSGIATTPIPGIPYNGFNRGYGKNDLAKAVAAWNATYAGAVDARGQKIPQLILPPNYSLGHGFNSQDIRLTKTFTFRERYKFSVFGEMFNVLNIANLGGYSGSIDTAGHLTWTQVVALNTAGNDIGSHTINHVDLKKLKLADARFQVCQDRVNIASHGGIQPESFAYPFGDLNSTVETQVVKYCGDNSGRGVSGVNDRTVFAETIPPLDPYATRTPADPKQGTTVATIEGYVTAAEQNGGGWVQLTFHHICSSCDAYSITAANMQALLDWLSTQVQGGLVAVESTRQVIGGAYVTPFCC